MGDAVYLAGKIAPTDWRHEVVVGLTDLCCGRFEEARFAWPRLKDAIFGRFDYVGPYFAEFGGHGEGHGERSHGLRAGLAFADKTIALTGRRALTDQQGRVVGQCVTAAVTADIVFAWLDDPTAFGTLIEIGAVFAQRYTPGKRARLIVARPDSLEAAAHGGHGDTYCEDDLWFASALPGVHHVRGPDPVSCLRAVLIPAATEPALESPAEVAFWQAWQAEGGLSLTPQHKVFGGQYRLDFAHLPSKTAIEIDGLAYHNGQAAFQKDHQRQRRLTQAGWRVVRFTAKEVLGEGRRCAREAMALCGAVRAGSTGPF